MYTIHQRASNHWIYRQGHPIKYIVIHGTESGTNQGEAGSLNYLAQNDAGVSAHDFVYDTRVWEMVPQTLGANCVAYSLLPTGETGNDANRVTYNIEGYKVRNQPMPMVVRETIAQRVADKARDFGWHPSELHTRILFHRDVDTRGKTCPGLDFNKAAFIGRVQDLMQVEPVVKYDKLCWVIEHGADILAAEGFTLEATTLRESSDYLAWKEERDN